jgi:hypothetical protein
VNVFLTRIDQIKYGIQIAALVIDRPRLLTISKSGVSPASGRRLINIRSIIFTIRLQTSQAMKSRGTPGHSSGFNSADLADVRERVITTPCCPMRPAAFGILKLSRTGPRPRPP